MRVIAGTAGSRGLRSFRGPGMRPTTDRVRESLFGVFGERVVGARFLDLYAGTGAVGIEALSRGAARCVLVEQSRQGAAVIRENLGVLGEAARAAEVVQADAVTALGALGRAGEQFDIVFADPPYEAVGEAARVLQALGASGSLLADGALAAVQHSRRAGLPEASGRLRRVAQRLYGDTAVSLYELRGGGGSDQGDLSGHI